MIPMIELIADVPLPGSVTLDGTLVDFPTVPFHHLHLHISLN